jgi:hypothetical protein
MGSLRGGERGRLMMQQTEKRPKNDTLTEQIIGAAIQIHRDSLVV